MLSAVLGTKPKVTCTGVIVSTSLARKIGVGCVGCEVCAKCPLGSGDMRETRRQRTRANKREERGEDLLKGGASHIGKYSICMESGNAQHPVVGEGR